MATNLPVPANTTCDIFRSTNNTQTPDVAGVSCYLAPRGQSTLTTPYFTHLLLVPPGTDVRDDYQQGSLNYGTNTDKVIVPQTGSVGAQPFKVVLVRRVGRGTSVDHLQVLLERLTGSWPTQNL
jgi:hypothetical protein